MIVVKTNISNMPKKCLDCKYFIKETGLFSFEFRNWCELTNKTIQNELKKQDWCPLVEVKDDKLE